MTSMVARKPDVTPGLIAALLVFCIYAGVALSVDFARAAFGIQSDEATYYMMGQSLANDGDLAYRREDLVRVWREFPSGPSGVFLKKGRNVETRFTSQPPFLDIRTVPDPDTAELFYGKSFAYPLFASPFVAVFGTNGFLLFHAVLLGLLMLGGYVFLNARSSPVVALILTSGFLMASVAPAYYVWITPELFNFALVVFGYVCWLYKEVMPAESAPRGTRWLTNPRSDALAAVLLAIATFSKPSNILLVIPLLAWLAFRRRAWRRALAYGSLFALVGMVLLAGSVAISGDWNFQGGDRRTFYGSFPFQDHAVQWEGVGQDRTTNRVLWETIFDKRVFWTVFSHNAGYFVFGRHSGLLPYFFPAVFATVGFLIARRRRAAWQWLVLAAALAEIMLLMIWIPYNYFGGGGVLGNRYFMNIYGVFLFLMPPLESVWVALMPWVVGTLFCAQVTFNPFFASFNPAEHAKQGPLRWLPVELTLVNDLPINTQANRARVWFGQQRRFQIYFLDDNAFGREGLSFWLRGRATADMLVKTVEPASGLRLTLASGEVATTVTASRGWWRQSVNLAPHQTTQLTIPLDAGFPYQGTRVWKISLRSHQGFVPLFASPGSNDNRFLGAQVTPELLQ